MKRLPITALLAVFFGWLLWSVSVRQAALFAVGIGLGAVLAGKRFGFTTGWRMLVEEKDGSGIFGQLLLLALAAALAMPLLGHFPELTAALGPPSISLLVGDDVYSRSAELGYWLGEPFWRKGIMTGAVQKMCEEAFRRYKLIRISAEPFSTNLASRGVLEKAGFTLEGIKRKSIFKNGCIQDSYLYAIIHV